jgi:uncharacterized SAM-binding protein YcdF (DUF218 family)
MTGGRRFGLIRRILGRGLASIVALMLPWLAGLIWFAATVPDRVDDPTSHTDAIVVLTGGSERMATGVALLAAGQADHLFVSGVNQGVDKVDILRAAYPHHPQAHPPVPPELETAIVLGYYADDTIGNATETATWVASQHFRSLRLVTAAYHMRRSMWEFHRAMPHVKIIPHPVFPDAVKSREWWLWPGTAALLATEYSKYLAAIVRSWLVSS